MVALLSRDTELYSTRSLQQSIERHGSEVQIIDVLSIEVRIGAGCFFEGKKLIPEFVIPRFSSSILLAGLAVLREWEREDVPLLNSSASIKIAHSQLETLQVLASANLPIPETSFCSQPSDRTLEFLSKNSAKVIKLLDTSQGKGVTLSQDKMTTKSLLTTLATLHSSGLTQNYYAESHGIDKRLIVLNGNVISAIERSSAKGEFRANMHRGASASNYPPTEAESALAIRACEALGLSFGGVDLISTESGTKVLEVNASPGLEGIEKTSQVSVSDLIAQLASTKMSK